MPETLESELAEELRLYQVLLDRHKALLDRLEALVEAVFGPNACRCDDCETVEHVAALKSTAVPACAPARDRHLTDPHSED